MNACIDENLPRSFASVLTALGFTVIDIRDHSLRGADDESVFNFAQQQQAILFTADVGFSSILQFPPGTHAGIMVLRFPNDISTNDMNAQAASLLKTIGQNDYNGNIIIVSLRNIRIRRSQKS